MKVNELTISKFQLKKLFEEFNAQVNEMGISAKYSWFIYKNCESMAMEYTNLMNSLYDERRENDYAAVLAAQRDLEQKYAEKNEDGNVKYGPDGRPTISGENVKKYEKDFNKVREQYKEFFERLDKKNEINQRIFNDTVTITATQLELSEFPPNTKPFIIGILGY